MGMSYTPVLLLLSICFALMEFEKIELKESTEYPGRLQGYTTTRQLVRSNVKFQNDYPYEVLNSLTFERINPVTSGLTFLGTCVPDIDVSECNEKAEDPRVTFRNNNGSLSVSLRNVTTSDSAQYRTRAIQKSSVIVNPNLTDVYTTLGVYDPKDVTVAVQVTGIETALSFSSLVPESRSFEEPQICFCSGSISEDNSRELEAVIKLHGSIPTANFYVMWDQEFSCLNESVCRTFINRTNIQVGVDFLIQKVEKRVFSVAFLPREECPVIEEPESNDCHDYKAPFIAFLVLFLCMLCGVIGFLLWKIKSRQKQPSDENPSKREDDKDDSKRPDVGLPLVQKSTPNGQVGIYTPA